MINSKALRNMEAITNTTQMMPSKEPVRFKLNTEAQVGFLYLSFLVPNDNTVNTTTYCGIQQQLTGLEIATDTVANATNVFSLAT